MKWHLEVLTPLARRGVEIIKKCQVHNRFYLAGGTGLALQLGHRFSEDLDFFSNSNPLKLMDREEILGALRAEGKVEVLHQKDGWLQMFLNNLSLTFLKYPYPLLKKSLDWEGISAASIEDIGLMKVAAILGRGTRRDFVDLYEICQQKDLKELLLQSDKKFFGHRDFLVQASKALVFFDDAEKDKMPRLIKKYDWEKIKAYFQRQIPSMMKSLL